MRTVVYLYDGSFEGLLTAVARAIKGEHAASSIKGIYAKTCYSPELFDRVIECVADEQQAARLREYLQGLGGDLFSLFCRGYLSEDDEVGLHLYRVLGAALQREKRGGRGGEVAALYSDDSVRYLQDLAYRVSHEAHKMSGFIRFRILADGLQYAPFEADHQILPFLARHFRTRLPAVRWILHDVGRDSALYWDGSTLCESEIDSAITDHLRRHGELPPSELTAAECEAQKRWSRFHSAIANGARENRGLQRQFMPRRYWKYLPEMA